jgi:hypothetical protein
MPSKNHGWRSSNKTRGATLKAKRMNLNLAEGFQVRLPKARQIARVEGISPKPIYRKFTFGTVKRGVGHLSSSGAKQGSGEE